MSIIRVSKRERYIIMDKTGLEDGRLSFAATGILAYLLAKPDDWTISYRDLVTRKLEGKRRVLAALNELESAGYLKREKKHVDGRYVWQQVLYECPHNANTVGALSDLGKRGKAAGRGNGSTMNAFKAGALTEKGTTENSDASQIERTKGPYEVCDECGCAVLDRDLEAHKQAHEVAS